MFLSSWSWKVLASSKAGIELLLYKHERIGLAHLEPFLFQAFQSSETPFSIQVDSTFFNCWKGSRALPRLMFRNTWWHPIFAACLFSLFPSLDGIINSFLQHLSNSAKADCWLFSITFARVWSKKGACVCNIHDWTYLIVNSFSYVFWILDVSTEFHLQSQRERLQSNGFDVNVALKWVKRLSLQCTTKQAVYLTSQANYVFLFYSSRFRPWKATIAIE